MKEIMLDYYPEELELKLKERKSKREKTRRIAPPDFVFDLVIDDLKTWTPGVLRVSMIGGNSELLEKIANVANEWTNHGNLNFDFGNWEDGDHSHIRIGFNHKGYWSLVGTDAMDRSIVDEHDVTLNLENFDSKLPDSWSGTVLHEFGHAIGFHHEQSSPAVDCDFNWEVLYRELAKPPNRWSKKKVDHNLRKLPAAGLTFSNHDPNSIMHYALPEWMFASGTDSPCFTPKNHQLSERDMQMMQLAYPFDQEEVMVHMDKRMSQVSAILELPTLPISDKQYFSDYSAFLNAQKKNI